MSNVDSKYSPYPWYKRGWGVLLIAFAIMVVFALAYVGIKTLTFYQQLKVGTLPAEIQERLTPNTATTPAPAQPKNELAYATEDDPVFGNPDAPLKIVEFADFECSFSQEESLIVRELQARFPEQIYFVYRDFPLVDIHPHAFHSAEAANCANDQGKFWPMHDKLYQNMANLTDLDLKTYALEIGLDIVKFNDCFDQHKYKDEVEVDRADGLAAGVEGTPTFFINGQKVPGAIPMEVWQKILAQYIKK